MTTEGTGNKIIQGDFGATPEDILASVYERIILPLAEKVNEIKEYLKDVSLDEETLEDFRKAPMTDQEEIKRIIMGSSAEMWNDNPEYYTALIESVSFEDSQHQEIYAACLADLSKNKTPQPQN